MGNGSTFFVGQLTLFIALILISVDDCVALRGYERVALDRHNEYRRMHRVGGLSLDHDLNEKARWCAQDYANRGTIDHKCRHKGGAGENLYVMYDGGRMRDTDAVSNAVKTWFDEVKHYNFDNPGFNGRTGHFTQVVWKNSHRLGIGVGRSSKGTFVTALYSPHGNFLNQFRENVLPATRHYYRRRG